MTVYVIADVKVTDDKWVANMQLWCTILCTNTAASIWHAVGT